MTQINLIISFLLLTTLSTALDNGLAMKPQMGWNSWNQFGCDIDEQKIKDAAD